ncbi:hypothetical protein VTO42DRAFT_3609 [Malbranchea cinnamomea]
MADTGKDVSSTPQGCLEPPAVASLRREARLSSPSSPGPAPMQRTLSEDIREECEDLQEAAEQTLNVVMDLNMDGRINWVSPSWKEVIGTNPADAEGQLIGDLILDNKTAFQDAVESLRRDDSRSQIVRFAVQIGPDSVFWREPPKPSSLEGPEERSETAGESAFNEDENVLNLEGQGIMVYEQAEAGGGHTMWMLRPSTRPREVTIGLPPLLVESLGVGAEMLANYLTVLADVGISDPAHHPPPMPILCRICERQITPWWFEKHSELCLQEHRAEMDVQIAQDNLNEHRHAIVKVLDALEARKGRPGAPGENLVPPPEYKGLPIGPPQTASSSGPASGTSSSSGTPPRSRDPSTSGQGHGRGRSFAVRRPLSRIVELILDLCDTALEINTPALKASRTDAGDEVRTQSPQSESRIAQVLQWQSPSSNTLDQEQGLAALAADTEQVARAKVDAVFRHRKIIEYAERIRIEFAVMVEECISAALEKAERLAAGDFDSSSSSSYSSSSTCDQYQSERTSQSQSQRPDEQEVVTLPIPGPSSRVSSEPCHAPSSTSSQSERNPPSVAVSTRSNSPMECPTPRSHRSLGGVLSQSFLSKRGSLLAESDTVESDSSAPSSSVTGTARTESPLSERGPSRTTSMKDGQRRSLVLPGISPSPRRDSPGRNPPHSPLRLSKPRLSTGESLPSPTTSPLLIASELAPPNYTPIYPQPHHRHHHRRQSSTTSPDFVGKGPISPHLSSVSQPPPRAVAPSIKDFEIIKPISKGAFGSVYLSKKKSTGEYFAIKVLKKADMVAKNQVTNVKAERAIMMWQGESDFVAKLYWTFSSKDYLYLVMEYLNGGDCASLVKVLGGLPEDWAKKYIAEVVLGVEHLHERGIVHRDLKPDNLLIDQKGHLKLTDFGLSRMGLVGRQKRIQKSPNDSAPDLLKQGPFAARSTSVTSSQSASFEMPTAQSPNSTPLITPEVSSLTQPSYFSLNKELPLGREPSRRASGHRSDSASSDTLNAVFRTFSLNDSSESPPISYQQSHQQQHPAGLSADEEPQSEGSESPYLFPVHQYSASHSLPTHHGTPPAQSMVPPAMALFDPADQNRRFVGTPDYLAPETITGSVQDEMCDWWSLGCILFEFVYGYPPFNADTPDEVFQNILNRRINWPDEADDIVSPECKDLMNKLMTTDPQERLGSNASDKFASGGEEIRSHPWFADINWDTLLEDEPQFVPAPENPEDTEYFDARGATLQSFVDEMEDQLSPPAASGTQYTDRPHDALFKVKTQQTSTSTKRGFMPLHIPPHVRDNRSRRLSEPTAADDFGNFSFKNLPILERANKDVIQKLKQEAMLAQQRPVPPNNPATPAGANSGPSLEGSPMLPIPLQRAMSTTKAVNRPASPSQLMTATSSSPSRASQPSSPLLVQFSTGSQHQERRKTSGSSATFSPQSSNSAQTSAAFEPPRLSTNIKMSSSSVASSPIKHGKIPLPSPDQPASLSRQTSAPASRARSRTIGSQDSDLSVSREPFIPGHHKRRSQLFDISPSSSDNEDPRTKALLKVQRRRQSTRRLSHINIGEGPFHRPLDVLICEDHPVSRLVLERLFEKLRCRTITAVNGSEAMRYALSEIQFDIILTEFKLPQINGADVARMIRDTRSVNTHTPIVAVTGYLSDLPETHHFDYLIEKPPTLSKLTEVLCKFCQWKPPPKDDVLAQPPPLHPPPHLPPLRMHLPPFRQMSSRVEDSPSSVASSFAALPTSSYRGSSRADSVGSSYFGDIEPVKSEDARPPTEEWKGTTGSAGGGLGISETSVSRPMQATSITATSQRSGLATPRRSVSIDSLRAKHESMERKRLEGAESGDDEDDELGHTLVRNRSPQILAPKGRRSSSKLGTEMMRTNSHGSIVSFTEGCMRCSGTATSDPVETKTTASVTTEAAGITSTAAEYLPEALERVHISDEGLEALPEVPEKEESCSPAVSPSPKLIAENQGEAPAGGENTEPSAPPTDSTQAPTMFPSKEPKDTAENESQTPPETTPSQPVATLSPHLNAIEDAATDTEVTPRPTLTPDPGSSATVVPQTSLDDQSEQTPRASDRDRSERRAHILRWMHG